MTNSPKNKVLVSWSTGKDSAYALNQIHQLDNYEIAGLLSTITKESNRVSLHSTRYELLKKQAAQLNLPLHPIFIPSSCTSEIYGKYMQAFLDQATEQGITHIMFGDLFLEDIRKYREAKLATTNIKPIFPLWGKNTKLLANEIINAGIKAVITCIDSTKLDISFIGREFDKQLLKDLPREIDPCGEYGEFHTFVYDNPMFTKPIPVSMGAITKQEDYIFIDVMHN